MYDIYQIIEIVSQFPSYLYSNGLFIYTNMIGMYAKDNP
jgi:hypothetical protein